MKCPFSSRAPIRPVPRMEGALAIGLGAPFGASPSPPDGTTFPLLPLVSRDVTEGQGMAQVGGRNSRNEVAAGAYLPSAALRMPILTLPSFSFQVRPAIGPPSLGHCLSVPGPGHPEPKSSRARGNGPGGPRRSGGLFSAVLPLPFEWGIPSSLLLLLPCRRTLSPC